MVSVATSRAMLASPRPLVFRPRPFCGSVVRFPRQTARRDAGITLAMLRNVAETSNRFVDDAIVMWRMQRAGGQQPHAGRGPRREGAVVVGHTKVRRRG